LVCAAHNVKDPAQTSKYVKLFYTFQALSGRFVQDLEMILHKSTLSKNLLFGIFGNTSAIMALLFPVFRPRCKNSI
jgi:hypothetical protein